MVIKCHTSVEEIKHGKIMRVGWEVKSLKELYTNLRRKIYLGNDWQLFCQNDFLGQEVKAFFCSNQYVIFFEKIMHAAEESSDYINNMKGHPKNWLYIDGFIYLRKG